MARRPISCNELFERTDFVFIASGPVGVDATNTGQCNEIDVVGPHCDVCRPVARKQVLVTERTGTTVEVARIRVAVAIVTQKLAVRHATAGL